MQRVRQTTKKKTSLENPSVKSKRTRKGQELLARLKPEPESKPSTPQVRTIAIDAGGEGQRLDNFLFRELKGVPKTHVLRLIRSGQVRVNKARAKPADKLNMGDLVRIPPVRVSASPAPKKAPPLPATQMPVVLFEDKDILVVDKPSGMASHGGSGISFGLIERLRASRSECLFLELAHRLDRGTSGVMILAKSRKALVRLHAMMRDGQVHKTYTTLVKGDWVNERQHIRAPLHKYVLPSGERRVKVDGEQGLPSHSIFRLLRRFGPVSLLEVDLLTGRTHQIRVHAASVGFPLVGDDKYGDFAFNDEVAAGSLGEPFKRMFLHASRVVFEHPITGDAMDIQAPLPTECQTLLEALDHV